MGKELKTLFAAGGAAAIIFIASLSCASNLNLHPPGLFYTTPGHVTLVSAPVM